MSRDEASIIATALEAQVRSKKAANLYCEPIEVLARKYRAMASKLTVTEEKVLKQSRAHARAALKGVVG